MRLIGWLLTCLLFASICTSVVSKKVHTLEGNTLLATAPIPKNPNDTGDSSGSTLSTSERSENENGKDLSDFRSPGLHDPQEKDEKQRMLAIGEGRTFGHKRIQFMLMPLMYKMGVMMTLLTVLTIISLKGLLIGAILLILKLGTIVGKFTSWASSHGHSAPAPPSYGWPPMSPNQPIHLHLHNSPHGHPTVHHHPYHGHGWVPPSASDYSDTIDRSQMEQYYYRG